MKNNAKQQSDILCPGQTFTICSESHAPLPNVLDHLHITGTADLITPLIEFKHFKTSINVRENNSN